MQALLQHQTKVLNFLANVGRSKCNYCDNHYDEDELLQFIDCEKVCINCYGNADFDLEDRRDVGWE